MFVRVIDCRRACMESPETAEHAGPGLRASVRSLWIKKPMQFGRPPDACARNSVRVILRSNRPLLHYCREYGHIRCYNCRFVTNCMYFFFNCMYFFKCITTMNSFSIKANMYLMYSDPFSLYN